MYLREVFVEHDLKTIRSFIRANPLGILTTAIESQSQKYPFLQSSHIPFILSVQDEESDTELGVLKGHMARANPQSQAFIEHFKNTSSESPAILEREVMVMFNLPANHYVPPGFYKETKPSTAKVVPTWLYAAAQAYGKIKVYYDSKAQSSDDYLTSQMAALTRHGEVEIMGHTEDGEKGRIWEMDDAPRPYLEASKKAVIGIEIEITRLEGKFKMSQEMGLKGDREGVVEGFRSMGTEMGKMIGDLVDERCEMWEEKKAEAKANA